MMGNPRCHWVRDRLPLSVGDDLRGLDRRLVERHLIGCPQCRQHQASLGQALETLRTVAATTPTTPDAPSLWPALARQIRESRRPSPTPTFAFPFPIAPVISWLRQSPWPALSLGLALLAAATVGLGVRHRVATAEALILANARPLAPASPLPRTALIKTPTAVPLRELPAPVEPQVAESSTSPRIDYDSSLDRGRPMPPDRGEGRDTRSSSTY
jgi:predicted anti-sigma-YlaC factor YlaD